MRCPFCEYEDTRVIDKRETEKLKNRRRRECGKCGKRFTTYESVAPMITRVVKRDGKLEDFSQDRITDAIFAAAQSVGGKNRELAKKLSDKVVTVLEEKFAGVTIPHVEQVQDIVEQVLVEEGHYMTAKAYILYRKEHERIRMQKDLPSAPERKREHAGKVLIYICESETGFTNDEKRNISASLKGKEVLFFDKAEISKKLKGDFLSDMGRNFFQITSSDFVLADFRGGAGMSMGSEIITAKLHKIPVVSIVKAGSVYEKYPFVVGLSDSVFSGIKEAGIWIKNYLNDPKKVKDISIISKAIDYYEDKLLEKDEFTRGIIERLKEK